MVIYNYAPKRHNDIAANMRLLGRLKLQLSTSLQLPNLQLESTLTADHFDDVIEAIELEGGLHVDESGRCRYSCPTFPEKVGHLLPKIVSIKFGQGIRRSDDVAEQEAQKFKTLYDGEYSHRVASIATASMKKKENKLNEMPATEDLQKLKAFLINKMAQLGDQLKEDRSPNTWRQLANCILTRCIVFNARRGSEVGCLLVSDYNRRHKYTIKDQEFQDLDDLEKLLAKRYALAIIGC